MCWRKIFELFALCNTPKSIISPIPLFAVSLFLISNRDSYIFNLPLLSIGILVSLFSNFGSNLWNHCNDIKEDIAQGKKTILTRDLSMQKTVIFISSMFYASSIIVVFFLSIEFKRPIYLYFLIWAFVTWWYSDNLFLKKITGFRLKDHYMGEIITYSIAWPMYTLSIWQIYSDLNKTGITITLAFLFLGLSGLLLKDLKDISGDKVAGLKTLGVVFFPSQLIKYSFYLMVMFYLVILNPLALNNLGEGILIMIFPFVYFLKNIFFHMYRKRWYLDIGDLKTLKMVGHSIYASVIFLGLSVFL